MPTSDPSHSLFELVSPLSVSYRWIHSSDRALARSIDISHLSYDHRAARPGSLHFCIRGAQHDGHTYAADAIRNGALAVVAAYQTDGLPVPQILVDNVREAMAQVANHFYGNPSDKIPVVGVTGTNGKTTTVHILQQLLSNMGVNCAAHGTLTGQRTTPESIDFQERLARTVDAGLDAVAVEVTSHGLAQHRVDGTIFEVAAFTNLSHDHLDYHDNMENYFDAKSKLFEPDFSRRCVVDTSSDWGRRLADQIGPDRLTSVDSSNWQTKRISSVGALVDWRGQEVAVSLAPRFYVENALLAAEIALMLGHDPLAIAGGLADLESIRGRYQRIDGGQPFEAIVDFAHTPSALEALLEGARELNSTGEIAVVFGCGGDRDKDKRPEMGEVAGRLADRVYLTSDNPRNEDPDSIIAQILEGMQPADLHKVVTITDRASAIAAAVADARPQSTVIIAGKGHEQSQEVAGQHIAFQDQDVVRQELTKSLEG